MITMQYHGLELVLGHDAHLIAIELGVSRRTGVALIVHAQPMRRQLRRIYEAGL